MKLRLCAALGIALALEFGGGLPGASASESGANAPEIPVLGTFVYDDFGKASGVPVVGAVHGVQRIAGGTAVYYSIGVPNGYDAELKSGLLSPGVTPYKIGDASQVILVDAAHLTGYRPLIAERGLVSDVSRLRAPQESLAVLYAVFPELPAETTTVDLQFEFGATVTNVPVTQEPLEPVVDEEFTMVGKGWPILPSAATVASADPAAVTFTLVARTVDIAGAGSTAESPTEVEVSLNADFFFEPGSAKLSEEAEAQLADLGSQVSDRGSGQVEIVGHTDSVPDKVKGNQELSEQRANAVGEVLTETLGTGFEVVSSGKAESEPVASNQNEEGRAQNRRVTVTYQVRES